MSRECPTKKGGNGGCFKCGEEGHMSRECPNKSGADNVCFGCRQPGHALRDCPTSQKNKACLKCGSEEHTYRNCTQEGDKFAFAECFVCKEKVKFYRSYWRNMFDSNLNVLFSIYSIGSHFESMSKTSRRSRWWWW